MEFYSVPVEGKVLLYRPLLRLAFVGNQAMADLTLDALRNGDRAQPVPEDNQAIAFLRDIGFLQPDRPAPPLPEGAFHPTSAVLLLTSRCNLRCTYCYAGGGERPLQDLSMDLARPAIDEAARNASEQGLKQFEVIFHGGGEPLQAWDVLRQAVAYARGKDLAAVTSMVSNGVWSTSQREWILENMDQVGISLDGRPETQDRQRPLATGRASSPAVMRTIQALDEAGFKYGLRMTAIAPWRGTLAEDVAFICEETGCKSIQVEPAFNTARGEHRGPKEEEAREFIDAFMEAFEVAARAGRQLIYSGARPWLLTQSFCRAPYGLLIASPSGALVGCFEATDELYPLFAESTIGSIDGDGIVIDEESRGALHNTLAVRRDACRECFCYWHCAGDCYSRVFASGADGPRDSTPRCTMNREITAQILLWYMARQGGVWRGEGGHPRGQKLMETF